MKRRRIGNKPPKPQPWPDFYEDDTTNDNQDMAYRTIQPEVEGWTDRGLQGGPEGEK